MKLTEKELMEDLFGAYYEARRNKRNTINQLRFEIGMERNLVEQHEKIVKRTYQPGKSICFVVTKPVKREVFAADFRDRVVHHLVFGYMIAMCERAFIDDSYSCRKGKGTLYGIERLQKYVRSCSMNYKKECHILKLDLKGYFMSIDKQVLKVKTKKILDRMRHRNVNENDELFFSMVDKYEQLKEERNGGNVKFDEIVDFELLWYLIEIVIDSDCTRNFVFKSKPAERVGLPKSKSLFFSPKGCGLPIGNLTSQLFSNIYLNDFDHFMKREMKLRYYGRYVDDFFVVHEDKRFLASIIPVVQERLWSEFRQRLHPHKIYLQHYRRGVDFLGARVKPFTMLVTKRTKVNFRKTVEELDKACEKELSYREAMGIIAKINSYTGYTAHHKAFKLREATLARGSFFKYVYLTRFCQKSVLKKKYIKKWTDELIKEVVALNSPKPCAESENNIS